MGNHLLQSGLSMAAIVGLGGPSMATKFAIDGPGDQLWQGTTCGMTERPKSTADETVHRNRDVWQAALLWSWKRIGMLKRGSSVKQPHAEIQEGDVPEPCVPAYRKQGMFRGRKVLRMTYMSVYWQKSFVVLSRVS